MQRAASIKAGDWRTVESFWNSTATAFFRAPAGVRIRVLYGYSPFSKERQNQTLDGNNYRKLTVGGWSFLYARIQLHAPQDMTVEYDVYPGTIAVSSPSVPF